MKINIAEALVALAVGTIVLGIWGSHIDYIGTYMLGIGLLSLGAGVSK